MSENEHPDENMPEESVPVHFTDSAGNTNAGLPWDQHTVRMAWAGAYKDDPANTVDPTQNTLLTGFNYGSANPWGYNPTLGATAGAGTYMGDSWFAPQPGIGQQQVYVHSSPPLTEERVREILRELLTSPETREIVKSEIRAVLEEDARELATNRAFQAAYVPARGVCWACGKPGQGIAFRWYTRGGHSHLVHDSEECMRLASEKPDQREHRG